MCIWREDDRKHKLGVFVATAGCTGRVVSRDMPCNRQTVQTETQSKRVYKPRVCGAGRGCWVKCFRKSCGPPARGLHRGHPA